MTEIEYNECVNLYADGVYRFILKNIRNEEEARDIVQSSFEKLWREKSKIEAAKSKSFLFTIAYHEMIDQIRKLKKIDYKEEIKDDEKTHQPGNQPKWQLREILNEALNLLNPTQRSLVMLKDYEGYSYQEIGAITGLNESQVKVYLHRARLFLRDYLVSIENVL